jgi:hypothetical protein
MIYIILPLWLVTFMQNRESPVEKRVYFHAVQTVGGRWAHALDTNRFRITDTMRKRNYKFKIEVLPRDSFPQAVIVNTITP